MTGGLLLTMEPGQPDPEPGWMLVGVDGRIAGLGEGPPPVVPAAETLDAAGCLVAPGFVSAHSHLFTSGSRGLAMDQSLYGWIDAMLGSTRGAGAQDVYWLTRHGAQDFLANGITTAYDFTSSGLDFHAESAGVARYAAAAPEPAFQHAQLRAKVDAGLRHVHSVMLCQASDRAAVFDHLDAVVELADEVAGDPTHLGMSISGTVQWAESPQAAVLEVAAMRRHGLTNQPHFLETPHEVEAQQRKFAWYRDAGALGPDLVFGHFIQTTDAILTEAAEAGCGVSWQPTSNGRLASGVAEIPRMRALGMRVGVGLDDQSCTDLSDPFANVRFGIYLLRALHRDPAAMPVRDMLEMHTRGSAEVLGVGEEVGRLAVGLYADFLVVDPRDPDTGPVWDPWGTYALACGQRNLKQVWVGGCLVTQDGRRRDGSDALVRDEVHGRLASLAARGSR